MGTTMKRPLPDKYQLAAAGVPLFKHSQSWSKVTPQAIETHTNVIDVAKQWDWINAVQEKKLFSSFTMVVGSVGTPDYARELAFLVFNKWWQYRKPDMYRPQWYTLWKYDLQIKRNPAGIVIDGVTATATNARLMKCFDTVQSNLHIPKIIVLSGVDDPLTFARSMIGIHVDYAVMLGLNKAKSAIKKVTRL